VKTIRSECLDQFVIFGERHLRHLVREFLIHYMTERYHQGIGGRIIRPAGSPSNDNAPVGGNPTPVSSRRSAQLLLP
jgi:hypothetical protein